ncbi:MAG: hypothetical protein AB7T06_29560 [Kofleriaceae bacterium]
MGRLALALLLVFPATAIADDDPLDVRGEVITVEGKAPPMTPPKPTNFKKRATPPYSDRAVLSDAWTRAWLLLHVDERGRVTHLKWLRKPGWDLEKIAMSEAFKLTFEPARDDRNKPMAVDIIWEMEWPSAWWLQAFVGTRSTAVPIVDFPPRRLDSHVPCRGSGPLHLGSVHPVYKDCSKPDLSKIKTQAWIARP